MDMNNYKTEQKSIEKHNGMINYSHMDKDFPHKGSWEQHQKK